MDTTRKTELKPAAALAGLSLSTLLASFGTSSANVALPSLAQAFGSSFQHVQWVVLAYLLAMTVVIVGVGRLADLAGRRRLLVAGLLVFTLASLACAIAPTLPLLVLARAAQGAGAAAMMALAMALVGETIPKARTGSAMGLLGTVSAVGTALGPTLGGALLSASGWPAIFLVNLPLGAVALLLVARSLPRGEPAAALGAQRFDKAGMALLVVTLGAYSLAMSGRLSAALALVALLGGALFVRVEARAAAPLVRLTLFRMPGIGAGFVLSTLVTTVVMATLIVGPFYLSEALGLAPAAVGAVMSVGPIVAALAGLPSGRLVDRLGAQPGAIAGLAAAAAGCAVLAAMPPAAGIPGYVVPLAFVTAGYALFQAANNTAVMTGIPPSERGVVAGLLTLSRNLGLVTGASAMGTVFALGGDAAAGMRLTFMVGATLLAAGLVLALVSRPQSHGADDTQHAARSK